MTRSVWKGPFVHPSLLKKIDKLKDAPNKNQLKLGLETLQLFQILLDIASWYIMVNLIPLQFQRKW